MSSRRGNYGFRGRNERNGFDNARVLSTGENKQFERKMQETVREFVKSMASSLKLEPMDRTQRKIVHEVAQYHRITTKSYGNEPNRYIVLSLRNYRINRSGLVNTDPISPFPHLMSKIDSFVQENPVRQVDMDNFFAEKQNKLYQPKNGSAKNRSAIPPKCSCSKEIKATKEKLPTTKYREQVLKSIDSSDVLIVSGGTGCGKTTQIPQFILENACEKRKKVRVMVTQPRRIAAISIAERVAKERGERIGDVVGFQVRLERKQSENTLLTYCTTGVLLRMLTADPIASGITHIILDEIHEREINTDYLLITLRQCLQKRPDLKIILMSATIEGNMRLFVDYFQKHSVDVISIESRSFDVETFHLDEILAISGYEPPESTTFFPPYSFDPRDWENELEEFERRLNPIVENGEQSSEPPKEIEECTYGEYKTLQGEVIDEQTLNSFMQAVGDDGNRPENRALLVKFVPTAPNTVFVNNVQYTADGGQNDGLKDIIPDYPITFRCDVPKEEKEEGLAKFNENGGFGMDYQTKHEQCQLLERKFRDDLQNAIPDKPTYFDPKITKSLKEAEIGRLRLSKKYALFFGAESKSSVDHELLDHVIRFLADSTVHGAILVFLPGYDDIQESFRRIEAWKNQLENVREVLVIPLHSQMHSIDHSDVFKTTPEGTRKIILATNIAEASITIEDVIFVVDTGKVKEKTYNHEAKLSTLTVGPIAKSNAKQRAGRAGRVANGFCLRLYSEEEYNEMPETQIAEMKRAAIYDVTLHAKLFAPKNTRVSDFLSLAPEPPAGEAIEQSIAFLEQIGALYSPTTNSTAEEDPEKDRNDPELTDLGRLMARLPLDPQLSRMLLFGLSLKCLTPIVNLVAILANRDPFLLTSPDNRDRQLQMKNKVAQTDFSDHLMLIRLCSNFCSKAAGAQQHYCRDHFLNLSTMRMVNGTRRQLVQELVRARLISIQSNRDPMSVLSDNDFNRNADSWPVVQAAIAAGCYPAIGTASAESKLKKIQTFNDRPAGLHPSSMLKKQIVKMNKNNAGYNEPRLEYVVFQELCQTPVDLSLSMKVVTAIPALTALVFTGPIRMNKKIVEDMAVVNEMPEEEEQEDQSENKRCGFLDVRHLEMDTWYGVRAHKKALSQFLRLRHKFMHFFLRGIHEPSIFGHETSITDQELLKVLRELLESEHTRHNFETVVMPNFYLKNAAPFDQKRNRKQPEEPIPAPTPPELNLREVWNSTQPTEAVVQPPVIHQHPPPPQFLYSQPMNYNSNNFRQHNQWQYQYQPVQIPSHRVYYDPNAPSHSGFGNQRQPSGSGQRFPTFESRRGYGHRGGFNTFN